VLDDWEDIVATPYQAPYCTDIDLSLGLDDD
jgi:hypothetical protein